MGGDLAPSLGGREKYFADQIFAIDLFRRKFQFLMTFLVIDRILTVFCLSFACLFYKSDIM